MSRLPKLLPLAGTLFFLLLSQTPALGQGIPSPARALAYELGERFTPVAGVTHCFTALAEASDLVSVHRYGGSLEGRPLLQVLVASTAHRARLEEILAMNRELTNPETSESRRQARGLEPNPNRSTREHTDPWPGGRPNHYLFDLNRDWAWMSQPETRARLATWNRWNPQVRRLLPGGALEGLRRDLG